MKLYISAIMVINGLVTTNLTLDAFNVDKKSKSTKKSSSPGPAQKGNYDSRTYSDEFLDGLYQNGG